MGFIKDDSNVNIVDDTPDNIKITLKTDKSDDTINNVNNDDVKTIELEGSTYNLNYNGDAIDDKGTIIKSKDDIAALGTQDDKVVDVEVDGVVYKLNETGDALNVDGSVFKTKADLDALANPPEKVIDSIIRRVNVIITDEKGNPVEYEDSEEGIAKYTEDAIRNNAVEIANKEITNWLTRDPELLAFHNYKKIHGTSEGFGTKDRTYDDVDIDKSEDDINSEIVLAARLAKGDTKEEADRFVSYSKDDGKIKEDAKASREFLKAKYAERNAEVERQILEEKQARINEDKEYDAAIQQKVLKEGKLNLNNKTYTLPKSFRIPDGDGKVVIKNLTDFMEYINVPVPVKVGDKVENLTGYQQHLIQEKNNRTVDNDIWEALVAFTKGDTSQFIEEQIKKANVSTLREKLSTKSISNEDKLNKVGTTPSKIYVPVK